MIEFDAKSTFSLNFQKFDARIGEKFSFDIFQQRVEHLQDFPTDFFWPADDNDRRNDAVGEVSISGIDEGPGTAIKKL